MSNKILLILLSATLITCRLYAQEKESMIMTLDECLEFAYEHNDSLKIAKLEQQSQDANVGEVMAEGFPQIDASADFRKNLALRTTFVPAEFFDPNASPGEQIEVTFGTPYEGDVGINASQMVFNGSYFVGLEAAKKLKELSVKNVFKQKIDIAEIVSKSYYRVLVAEEALRIMEANYTRLDSLLNEQQVMYENGMIEKIELSRTQVEFNNAKTKLDNQQRQVAISKTVLKFHTGIPMDQQIEIADKPSDLKINYAQQLTEEVNEKRRVEYQQLQIRERLAHLNLRNNQAQYLPQIDLYFGMGMNAGTNDIGELFSVGGSKWFDYRQVGFTVSLPIFDGLMKSYRIQQNRLQIEQIRTQFNQLERSIHMGVNNAKTQLLNSINNLRNQEENMELAKEVYDVSKIKYEEGVGSSIELIDADRSYKEAQSNYYTALLEALLAKVDYEKSLGILIE